jgi:hypothetical protein
MRSGVVKQRHRGGTPMKRTHVMVLTAALLAPVFGPPAEADSKYKPCSLLTTAEIEAVLGTKVAETKDQDIPVTQGAYKGEIMSGCTWTTKGPVSASLSIIRSPRTPQEQAAGGASIRHVLDGLQAKGWKVESTSMPGAICSRATPPPSSASAPTFASCFTEAKGMAFAIYAFSASVTPQQVKSLADKAGSRLR